MRKSILRFGALALMSMMSISAFAEDVLKPGEFFAVEQQGKYYVILGTKTVEFRAQGAANHGTVLSKVKDSNDNEYDVVAIGEGAFKNNTTDGILTIPNSVTRIEKEAFSGATGTIYIDCSKLVTVKAGAFKDAVLSNTAVDLSNLVTCEKNAFESSNVTSVLWSEKSQSVPEAAFKNCESLEIFKINKKTESGDYLTTISKSAFEGCRSLWALGWLNTVSAEYCLPKTLYTVGERAFKGCASLCQIKFSDLVTNRISEVGDYAFAESGLNSEPFNRIFSDEAVFGVYAFSNALNLGDIVLPKNVKLTQKTANNVTSGHTFYQCGNLLKVKFQGLSALVENCFSECSNLHTLTDLEKTSLTTIPAYAFKGTVSLYVVKLPNSVTTIEKYAFDGSCVGDITWNGVTDIKEGAFANTTMYQITFPSKLKSIGKDAFEGNINLWNITICGQNADAENFKPADKVNCLADAVFDASIYSSATLTVPYGCRAMYMETNDPQKNNNLAWHNFVNVVTPAAAYNCGDRFWVGGLCYEVVDNCGYDIASVKVVDGLYKKGNKGNNVYTTTKSQEQAKDWNGHTPLAYSITIPQYVATRYDVDYKVNGRNVNAYYKVTGLECLNQATLTEWNDGTRSYVPTAEANAIAAVKTVTIEAPEIAVPQIFNVSTENNCKVGFLGLETFKTDKLGSIKSIDPFTFENCDKLSKVSIKTTTDFDAINSKTFNGCKSLAEFTIPSTTKWIYDNAFNGTALTKILIPKSVVYIGSNVFNFTFDSTTKLESGVKDVYCEWTDLTSVVIDFDAFGTAQRENRNGRTYLHLRNLHYPTGQQSIYENYGIFMDGVDLFDIFEGIEVNEKNVYMVVSNDPYDDPYITLEDNSTRSVKISQDLAAHVTYKRNIREDCANNWQCWYVPFEVYADEVEGATFAMLYDTKVEGTDNKGVAIELKKVEGHKLIKANTCYVVKFATAGDKEIKSDSGLKATEENSFSVSCTSDVFTFKGLYHRVQAADNTSFYIVNPAGNLQYQQKDNFVNAYRFKMNRENNTENPYAVKFVVLDDDATAIENVKSNSLNAPMFDLMGRQIAAPAKGQVYIQNGVKKLAK